MDRIAIEEKGIPGIKLMRKAGLAVFELIQMHYSDKVVSIFCGAGNNAGDGYVVAKLAKDAGYNVIVYYLSKPENLKGDALTAYQDYSLAGGKISEFSTESDMTHCIIIDALFGTGLSREVSGDYAKAIDLINHCSSHVISVDIPSGLNADTGMIMGCAVKANYTVSFIGLKQGMFTGFAADYCGHISYSSLDITDDVIRQVDYSSRLITQCFIPKRSRCVHKGDNGHVLVIGGDEGFSGSIRLSAEAALRVGAGLVSVATHKAHASLINSGRPELMCHGIETPKELEPLLNKATVVVMGPGLGQAPWGKGLFEKLRNYDKPMILDADALNLLADNFLNKDNWVLTPHPGEAARLQKCSTSDIAKDRFTTVSLLQKKYGGVVVLKGAGTLICNGDDITVSTAGNPGMASGGMGDALTGMIAGLVAQNMDLYTAATSAVFLHGKAADLSAQQGGEIGLLASDLLPFIRRLVNDPKITY